MIAGKVLNNVGVLKQFSQKTKFSDLSQYYNQFFIRTVLGTFLVLFSATNGLNGSFSSEDGVSADVTVLKHFSKKLKL